MRLMRRKLGRNLRNVVLIVAIVTMFDLRVLDTMLSGKSTIKTFNVFDLEIFDGTDVIRKSNNIYARQNKYLNKLRTKNKLNLLCRNHPPNLIGNISFRNWKYQSPAFEDTITVNPKLDKGGRFSPSDCKSRHRVAIIIPFRNRTHHLKLLLAHMHPIWQRQQIDYKVFVINQAGIGIFNKAKLMNIGVAQAEKDGEYDCYVFQDVDLLLEDDRCLYWCHKDNPRHLSVYIDKFSYKIRQYLLRCPPLSMYVHERVTLFGGVTMFSREQFHAINGFSNLYWGWGEEDDDVYMRIKNRGYKIENPHGKHCSFRMVQHNRDAGNPAHYGAFSLLFHAMSRIDVDGYKSLRYRLLKTEEYPLYTNVTVDVGQPSARMREFLSDNTKLSFALGCWRKMPWDI